MSFYIKKYLWVFHVVCIVVASYFLARMTTTIIGMKMQASLALPQIRVPTLLGVSEANTGLKRDEYKPITARNIFDSKAKDDEGGVVVNDETPEKEKVEEPVNTGEARPTQLKILLFSTLSVGEGKDKRSSCIIVPESKKDDQQVFTIGDAVPLASESKVVRILNHRVEFINKGQLEYVEYNDEKEVVSSAVDEKPSKGETKEAEGNGEAVEKVSETSFVIPRSEVDKALSGGNILTQIAIVPDPKGKGFKIRTIAPGSIFTKLGLKRGDTLLKVNGNELTASGAMDLFNQLKSETKFNLEVERRGKAITYDYEVR